MDKGRNYCRKEWMDLSFFQLHVPAVNAQIMQTQIRRTSHQTQGSTPDALPDTTPRTGTQLILFLIH